MKIKEFAEKIEQELLKMEKDITVNSDTIFLLMVIFRMLGYLNAIEELEDE